MMLLRTLVLERSGQDAPVNGAVLCGFAVTQIAANFLVYSLDEETEPGSSRVYIASLRKKMERYFLGGVESQEDLQVAMHVFKQILTLAASGVKVGAVTETPIPYHFIDLKGCKLPPARPEDHHSVIIKKALVMKVITLGTSAPVSPAIESAALIVPSIRFSSQMVSPPKVVRTPEPAPLIEPPALTLPLPEPQPASVTAQPALNSLFEVDSTLTNLARVAQELTQQKLAVLKREEALELWHAQLQHEQAELERSREDLLNRTRALDAQADQLANACAAQQQEQRQLDEGADALAKRVSQVHAQESRVRQQDQKLAAALLQLPGVRQQLQGMLLALDQALDGLPVIEPAPAQEGAHALSI